MSIAEEPESLSKTNKTSATCCSTNSESAWCTIIDESRDESPDLSRDESHDKSRDELHDQGDCLV